ncbi:molybdopterin molybdenumtransferase MoeA [Amylibacter kogurei]|uniref:Molybdopterin molybdenumtransferase n=1 Tax=Paramylibacter kogurei TaxID=1889778 RepID=A0A2G5K270_9RHOB|nr:gephyrin-like molybdotransferase Glp [Amylibacter kogurei]PIB23219.1 molybdopterin molybdenumtransferase MoeA [Amylibacter kogurei]
MTQLPKLSNDCFALPRGVDWTPVDVALAMLKDAMKPVVRTEQVEVIAAGGRILAKDVFAKTSNPPFANSAVDGYGFAFDSLPKQEQKTLPLIDGRAAAGQAYDATVPPNSAIRVLTGARLPDGVDTVILQEDVHIENNQVHFESGLKQGANTRRAGEDVISGELLFQAGHKIQPQDIAIMSATGVDDVNVYQKLRVGVLSTGDELVSDGNITQNAQIFDANRPMLLDLLSRWGYVAVDLGHVGDDPDQIRQAFAKGAKTVDAIITTGGASAGDEDHVSNILTQEATLQTWRVAIKPGRPLALAMWQETPIFGFPGNPVAAFVCSLIFARPALSEMAGAGWNAPRGFQLPAAFSKSKKAGRREFLRARLNDDNQVEIFKSEGSGRISGLSWATGLVELPDHKMDVAKGDLITFYPYGAFGI